MWTCKKNADINKKKSYGDLNLSLGSRFGNFVCKVAKRRLKIRNI